LGYNLPRPRCPATQCERDGGPSAPAGTPNRRVWRRRRPPGSVCADHPDLGGGTSSVERVGVDAGSVLLSSCWAAAWSAAAQAVVQW